MSNIRSSNETLSGAVCGTLDKLPVEIFGEHFHPEQHDLGFDTYRDLTNSNRVNQICSHIEAGLAPSINTRLSESLPDPELCDTLACIAASATMEHPYPQSYAWILELIRNWDGKTEQWDKDSLHPFASRSVESITDSFLQMRPLFDYPNSPSIEVNFFTKVALNSEWPTGLGTKAMNALMLTDQQGDAVLEECISIAKRVELGTERRKHAIEFISRLGAQKETQRVQSKQVILDLSKDELIGDFAYKQLGNLVSPDEIKLLLELRPQNIAFKPAPFALLIANRIEDTDAILEATIQHIIDDQRDESPEFANLEEAQQFLLFVVMEIEQHEGMGKNERERAIDAIFGAVRTITANASDEALKRFSQSFLDELSARLSDR